MTSRTATRAIGAAVLLLAVLAALCGCAGPVPSPPPSAVLSSEGSSSAPTDGTAAASDGRVVVGVTQGRSDSAADVFALTVENTTEEELAVRSAVLRSPAFRGDVVWEGDTTVPPGSTRDLRVPVPDFTCPLTERSLVLTVDYGIGGVDASATLVPLDPFMVIERLSDGDCHEKAVAAVVDIRLSDDVVVVGSGPSATAALSLVLRPADGLGDGFDDGFDDGRVTIVSVDATTLLSPDDGSPRWDVGETVSVGDDPRTVTLTAAPARCDAHAIAEDKLGTVLQVRVRLLDGTEGPVSVAASPGLRSALYSFITDACSA